MKVPFATFRPMEQELEAEFKAAFDRVFRNSWYIGGQEDDAFEAAFAAYCGAKYCVGVGNGLVCSGAGRLVGQRQGAKMEHLGFVDEGKIQFFKADAGVGAGLPGEGKFPIAVGIKGNEG